MFRSKYIALGLMSITTLSAYLLISSTASAETYTKSALVRVNAACTMDGLVSTPHTATVSAGSYRSGIGSTVFNVTCNDDGGFGVYAIGYTSNTDGNNLMVNDNDSTVTFNTGKATSGNESNWAMRLTTVDGDTHAPTILNGYNNYEIVPSDYVKVAEYPSSTEATGATFLTDYAAYISLTQTAGSYTGQVKYVLVHPSSGDAPEKEEPESNPINQAMKNAGKTKKRASDGEEYYAMQDMTSNICAAIDTPVAQDNSDTTETKLVDVRDGKVYWVAKLKDGHCWMTQNLDLDLSTAKKLTHADTDLGWTTLNTNAEWTPERDTIAFDGSTTTTVSGWTNSYTDPYSADPGTQYVVSSGTTENDTVFYTLETCMNNNTPDITTDDRTAGECSHYHTGNYYNWTAAIASNDSTAISTQYDVAPDSICPAGWRLSQSLTAETQTEEVASEWNKLLVAQGITSKWGKTSENTGYGADGFKNIRHTPLFLVRAGFVGSVSLFYRASDGYYWSSSVYSSNGAYHLYFYSSSVSPSSYNNRHYGFAARCVAR